jgi:transposase
MAIPLLEVARPVKRLLADKAYDANRLRQWLKAAKIKAVIPSWAARKTPYPLDHKAYRRCNVIERLFRKLKNWHVSLPAMTDWQPTIYPRSPSSSP